MIIRKPYAFLVKHFKKIHFLLLLPLLYIAYKSFNLMQFFNNYVVDGYKTTITDVASKYLSFLIPIASLVMIAVCGIIVSLFRKKNREYGAYLTIMLFYIIIFIISLFLNGVLTDFETKDIDSAIAIMFSGFSRIIFYIQPVLIIIFLFKAFGFNFRHFEFVDVKDDISLDDEDSEEVEVSIGINDYKFRRGVRRYFRELKYYVIENKAYFFTFAGIIGLVVAFFLIRFIISLNRVVRVDKAFTHSSFSVTFNDSVLSTMDYNGNVIQKDKIYLAVKTTIRNNTKGLLSLDTDNFWLTIGDNVYYPKLDRSGKFIDLAKPYYGEKVGAGVTQEIVLVYELDNINIQDRYKIKVLDSITYKENGIIPKYKEITLTPRYSSEIVDNGTFKLGDTIDLSKTTLLNTKINLSEYEIGKTFQYKYEYCYEEKCYNSTNSVTADHTSYLIGFKGSITLDENSTYSKYKLSNNNFITDFVKVEYTMGDITNLVDAKDITPSDASDIVILQTVSDIRRADSINLIITVRNQRYTLKVK